MIRDDRELLVEMARVNCDVTPLAMRVMNGSVTTEEQLEMAGRLIALGQRLRERADNAGAIVEGQVVADRAQEPRSTVPNRER